MPTTEALDALHARRQVAVPYTSATDQVLSDLFLAGFAPRSDIRPYNRSRRVMFDAAAGPDSPFGVVVIGATTGRVLRASFARGSYRPYSHTTGTTETRNGLRGLIFRWHASQPRKDRTR